MCRSNRTMTTKKIVMVSVPPTKLNKAKLYHIIAVIEKNKETDRCLEND